MGSPLSADQLETLLRGKWSFWDEYRHEITRIFETMDITFTPVPSKPRARTSRSPFCTFCIASSNIGNSHPALPTSYSCVSSSRRCSASYTTISHALHACSIPSTAPRPSFQPRSSLLSSSLATPVWPPQPTMTTSSPQPMHYAARSYTSTPSAHPLPPRTQLTLSSTPFSQHAPSRAPPSFRAEYPSTSQSPQRHLAFQPHTRALCTPLTVCPYARQGCSDSAISRTTRRGTRA